MPTGIILKGIGGFYYVSADEATYECKARGIFRKNDVTPLPGDRVNFSVTDEAKKKGSLDEILPRFSQLTRPAVSNINQVVLVIAAKSPAPDLLLLDKLLVTAVKENIKPVICLNKLDLDMDGEGERIFETYKQAGYGFLRTSTKTGQGLEELEDKLKSMVTVFAGQSGVGKSTLLNSILKDLIMETGDLSIKTDRGKHTTRHAELLPLVCGGYIVDTPGFSSFELENIEQNELQHFYSEFSQIAEDCRFSGCSHANEPDCKIKEQVKSGRIDRGRYERYIELLNYLKQVNAMKYKKFNKDKEKRQ